MRNASPALIAFLNSLSPTTQPYIADLLTVVQKNGTVTRITSAATDIASTSQAISPTDPTVYTFLSGGVTFNRGATKLIVGLEVDDLSLTLMSHSTDLLGGVPWPAAARNGALDGALIIVERAFMPTWNDTSAGTLIIFSGIAGDIHASRSDVQIAVKALINILANSMPRNIYQPACLHALFDVGCTLSRAAFTVTGAAVAGSTALAIVTGLAAADRYYELGSIKFTSGLNAGIERPVRSYVSNVAGVSPAFPNTPVIGDAFSIYPGCDKAKATCSAKFSNAAHFRGYPFIPVPENAG